MSRIGRRVALAILFCLIYGPAFSGDAGLRVTGGWVRGLPPVQTTTAAFLDLYNGGSRDRVLVAAGSEMVDAVEVHAHSSDGGVMRMRPAEQVTVPAGGRVAFRPGGLHLMLFGVRGPLHDGDRVPLWLEFADGARLDLQLEVRSVLRE